MADPIRNFAKVTVSLGYDAVATSIVLGAGDGLKLPAPATDGAFNVVWWDSTTYNDPSDDPNVEIVRVTAKSTDTLTVTRAQESTSASTKNTAGKTYKMILSPTAASARGSVWGDSITGTSGTGFSATIGASAADATAGLALTADNTQTFQPVLANLQLGTSGNVMGLLIQGTGGATGGAAGTGLNHMTLWGDTASNGNKVLSVGNGVVFSETLSITANGIVTSTPANGSLGFVVSPVTGNGQCFVVRPPNNFTGAGFNFDGYNYGYTSQTGNSYALHIQLGTLGKFGSVFEGTGSASTTAFNKHLTLWGNTSNNVNKVLSVGYGTSYTETLNILAEGFIQATPGDGSYTLPFIYLTPTNLTRGVLTSIGLATPAMAQHSIIDIIITSNADNSAVTPNFKGQFQFSVARQKSSGSVTSNFAEFYISRQMTTSGTGAATEQGSVLWVENTSVQSAGTLTDTVTVLKVTQIAASTGDVVQLINGATTNLAFTSAGNLCLGVGTSGATAANGVLCLSNGATAPTTSVDRVHLYGSDLSVGNAALAIFAEAAVTTAVQTGDTTIPIRYNGVIYNLLAHT